MKINMFLVATALLILGCQPAPVIVPTPETPSLFPPPTNTSVVNAALPEAAPTSQSSLFSDLGTMIFRDDFEETLDAGWEWLREDAGNWSLTAVPGSLQINAGAGHVNSEGNANLLLRSMPSGNIQIETKLIFNPVANFQFAGIIIYESPTNFVQVGRAYCMGEIPRCLGDGFYMDYYLGGGFVAPNYSASFTESVPVYLQLIRRGTSYTLQTSTDGDYWTLRGTTTSAMNPLQIGLVAGQNTSSLIPAVFDYFEVQSLP